MYLYLMEAVYHYTIGFVMGHNVHVGVRVTV